MTASPGSAKTTTLALASAARRSSSATETRSDPRPTTREEQDAIDYPAQGWHSSHGTLRVTGQSAQSYGILSRSPCGVLYPPAWENARREGAGPRPTDTDPVRVPVAAGVAPAPLVPLLGTPSRPLWVGVETGPVPPGGLGDALMTGVGDGTADANACEAGAVPMNAMEFSRAKGEGGSGPPPLPPRPPGAAMPSSHPTAGSDGDHLLPPAPRTPGVTTHFPSTLSGAAFGGIAAFPPSDAGQLGDHPMSEGGAPSERASLAVSEPPGSRVRRASDSSETRATRHNSAGTIADERPDAPGGGSAPSTTGERRGATPTPRRIPAQIVYKRFNNTGNELYDYGVEINAIRFIWSPDLTVKSSGEHVTAESRERVVLRRHTMPDPPDAGWVEPNASLAEGVAKVTADYAACAIRRRTLDPRVCLPSLHQVWRQLGAPAAYLNSSSTVWVNTFV